MFPRVTHPSATLCCHSVRLACVKPAASVRSEPGSNSQVVPPIIPVGLNPRHNQWTLRFRCRLVTAQSSRPGKLSTSPKHTRPATKPESPVAKRDEFENVTARVSHDPQPRPESPNQESARTPPSTFLLLPIQLSNSAVIPTQDTTRIPTTRWQTRAFQPPNHPAIKSNQQQGPNPQSRHAPKASGPRTRSPMPRHHQEGTNNPPPQQRRR